MSRPYRVFSRIRNEAQNEYNLRCYWISLCDNGFGTTRARGNVDLAGAAGLWLLYSDDSDGLGAVKFPQKRGWDDSLGLWKRNPRGFLSLSIRLLPSMLSICQWYIKRVG